MARRSHPRPLLAVMVMVGVALGAPLAAALLHEPGSGSGSISAASVAASTPAIARDVENVRELSFERVPEPQLLGVEELTKRFQQEAERTGELEEAREDEAVLKLLGLVEEDADLSELTGSIAEDVAGAYDPRTEELFVIRDSLPDSQAVVDVTIAHELTHALEDQRLGLPELEEMPGDRALAAQALIEGTATAVMIQYAAEQELFGAFSDFGELESSSLTEIPPVIQAQLLFSYLRGFQFVQELRRAGRDWDLVNVAGRSRLPLSTEQVIHPGKYLTYEKPAPVPVASMPSPGAGWELVDTDTVGEFDLTQLLRLASSDEQARSGAAGWGGARFTLWRRAGAPDDCESPCRSQHALVLSTRWDTPTDALEFSRQLSDYTEAIMGPVAFNTSDEGVVIALAPSSELANRLAGETPD